MTDGETVELMGANATGLPLVGMEARAEVSLAPEVQRKLTDGLSAFSPAEPTVPDRVFLNLENVRGLNDAVAFNVYVNLPATADPQKNLERLAGSIALFGVRRATRTDAGHAGDGLNFVLEITRIVDSLHRSGELDAGKLEVRLIPVRPVSESAKVTIGRISVYRQSG